MTPMAPESAPPSVARLPLASEVTTSVAPDCAARLAWLVIPATVVVWLDVPIATWLALDVWTPWPSATACEWKAEEPCPTAVALFAVACAPWPMAVALSESAAIWAPWPTAVPLSDSTVAFWPKAESPGPTAIDPAPKAVAFGAAAPIAWVARLPLASLVTIETTPTWAARLAAEVMPGAV